jgi:hypothetical protein
MRRYQRRVGYNSSLQSTVIARSLSGEHWVLLLGVLPCLRRLDCCRGRGAGGKIGFLEDRGLRPDGADHIVHCSSDVDG